MKRGFTLIEIMIVVALVIILSSISVVNIMRSRIVALEGVAVGNLKILSDACQMYHLNNDTFPADLASMHTSSPAYIDGSLASGTKQRYNFIYARSSPDSFTINANPVGSGLLRGKYFYVDESSIMRSNPDEPAGPGDPPIE